MPTRPGEALVTQPLPSSRAWPGAGPGAGGLPRSHPRCPIATPRRNQARELHVEIVRRQIEAWNGRDLTTWLALFRSDAEIDWSRARAPFRGVSRGQGELEAFWDEFWSTFEDVQLETYGFAEAGSEVVYSNTSQVGGARGSK